ncbi:hypothetical protein [Crocosphaera chwakensis]|uniref:Uncharacterized protein n=1 Tax=Crocosphaera chwakensis CCY0110 TaxID=391612 RepID=A3ITI7_9CHRO|nr:hypothetical protein [Crocosphaera chwakensis]EAZ90168.1 hypothetical protein CY0110_30498 [Crocosphaera chwakensis CCY0110]
MSKIIANRKKLQEKLQQATDNIEFLLQVEKAHCENNRQTLGESRKNKVREMVRNDGFEFSGKFTLGRVKNNDFK